MKKPEIFKKLNAYDHFLVFLIILSVLKITNVFIDDSQEAGFHFIKLGAALFVISSVIFMAFKYGLDKRKKYQHALISTLIILLVLSHAELNPVRGVLVILLLYISKFLIKYKKQNIFISRCFRGRHYYFTCLTYTGYGHSSIGLVWD